MSAMTQTPRETILHNFYVCEECDAQQTGPVEEQPSCCNRDMHIYGWFEESINEEGEMSAGIASPKTNSNNVGGSKHAQT